MITVPKNGFKRSENNSKIVVDGRYSIPYMPEGIYAEKEIWYMVVTGS